MNPHQTRVSESAALFNSSECPTAAFAEYCCIVDLEAIDEWVNFYKMHADDVAGEYGAVT